MLVLKMSVIYFLLIIFQTRVIDSGVKKNIEGGIRNYSYYFNPKYSNVSITHHQTGSDKWFNGDMVVLQPIPNIFMSFFLQYKVPNNPRYQTITKVANLNCCAFMNGAITDSLIKIAYGDLMKHSNFSPSCPVQPGYYYLRNYKIGKVSPLFAPGDYKIIIEGIIKTKINRDEHYFSAVFYTYVK